MIPDKCPKCGGALVIRKGYSYFRGCARFPACRYTDKFVPEQEMMNRDTALVSVNNKNPKSDMTKSKLCFPNEYIVFDLETTGLSPANCEIIEIAALKYAMVPGENGTECRMIGRLSTLVRPRCLISSQITGLTGITNRMVFDAPFIEDILSDVLRFFGKTILVGHNVTFDLGFMQAAAGHPLDNEYVDTLRLARLILPERKAEKKSYSLQALADDLCLPNHGCHRAEADVVATNDLLQMLHLLSVERNIQL